MIDLTNKPFIRNMHDTYRTGCVIGPVSPTHYLVRFDTMDDSGVVLPTEVVSLEEMSSICDGCGGRFFEFFETPAELQRYLERMGEPSKAAKPGGNVLHLRKPH